MATAADRDDPEPSVDPTGSTTHYAGTAAGLWEEPAPGAWTLRPPNAPPGNAYTNIVMDGARVYAATRSEGIGRWDGTDWLAPATQGVSCAVARFARSPWTRSDASGWATRAPPTARSTTSSADRGRDTDSRRFLRRLASTSGSWSRMGIPSGR